LDWLTPLLPRLAASPHVYMLVTKRGRRLHEFSELYPLPANIWLGGSVTRQVTAGRVADLLAVRASESVVSVQNRCGAWSGWRRSRPRGASA
jgi:protein gp37